MYFAKTFQTPFKYLYFLTLSLMASSVIYFQTMPSQGALTSVFNNGAIKILRSSFKNTCIYLSMFVLQFQVVCKDYLHVLFMCFCYTFGFFFHKKPQKDKWSNYCFFIVRKNLFQVSLEREDWKFLKKQQNG